MSLRQARFDDHWRHVYLRQFPTKFSSISVEQLRTLANATVKFSAGISAIVGSNGVGKSTLIAAIAELLANAGDVAPGHRIRLAGSTNIGIITHDQVELQLRATSDLQGKRILTGVFDGEFRWLDPSALASDCLRQIHADQNFGDLLEQVAPLDLNAEELDIASYLIGKTYTKILIYEIGDYADFERFPYFKVSSGGAEYRSEEMGRGELALLLAYWELRDLPKNSILILEEPETHVSPRSQLNLMNIVAKFSHEHGLWVIITTHSPTIIGRIPQEHVKFIARDVGPAALVQNATSTEIAMILGGGVAYRGVLLTEDEAGKAFTLSILEVIAPDLLPQFEILVAGSEDGITSALDAMPKTGKWLMLIGVYDGDKRDKEIDVEWPFVFLPGIEDPDRILKSMTGQKEGLRDLLAAELRRASEPILIALNLVAGIDYHDFIVELAAALHETPMAVRRALFRIWLTDQANSEAATLFMASLREAFN